MNYTDLLIHDAVEDEDEESLEAVEDGKDVSHNQSVLVDVEQPKCPGEAE